MSAVLLDTTVASLLHPKRKGSATRALYEPHLTGRVLALSFQTVAELWRWAEENSWGEREREGLQVFVGRFAVVAYTPALAVEWARVMTITRRSGRRLEAGDAWIAASAALHGVALVTHDRDFVGLGVDGLDVICHAT